MQDCRFVDLNATVGEGRQVEVGLELAVHAAQQVQGELGGDARRIVVGVVQAARVLFEIDPEHQGAAVAQEAVPACRFEHTSTPSRVQASTSMCG